MTSEVKTLRDLIGGRIIQAVEGKGEDPAVLVVRVGRRVAQVEFWRDAEGNGPGHADVWDTTDAQKVTRRG